MPHYDIELAFISEVSNPRLVGVDVGDSVLLLLEVGVLPDMHLLEMELILETSRRTLSQRVVWLGVDCDTGVLIDNVLHDFAEEIVEGRNLLGDKTVMLKERTDDCPSVVLSDLLGILFVNKVVLVL